MAIRTPAILAQEIDSIRDEVRGEVGPVLQDIADSSMSTSRVMWFDTVDLARANADLFSMASAVEIKNVGTFYAAPLDTTTPDDGVRGFALTGVATGRFVVDTSVPKASLPRLGLGTPSRELDDRFGSDLKNQWRVQRDNCAINASLTVTSIEDRVTRRAVNQIKNATDANRPVFASSVAALGGRPAVDFGVTIGHAKLLYTTTSDSITPPYSRFVVFAPRASMAGGCRIFGNGDATRGGELYTMNTDKLYYYNGTQMTVADPFDSTSLLGHLAVVNVQDKGYSAKSRTSSMVFRSDGKIIRSVNGDVSTGVSSGTMAIGGFAASGTQGFPGYIADSGQIARLMSATDFAEMCLYASELYGFTLPDREVMFDGNSLTVETTLWPKQIVLNARTDRQFAAHGGWTSGMVADQLRFSAQSYTSCLPNLRRAWCGGEMTNDISAGVSLVDCIANVRAIVTAASAAGFTDIIMSTCGPRSGLSVEAEAIRVAANADLHANWASYGITKLVNIDTLESIDGQTCPATILDSTNLTYFTDGVHHTAAGYAIRGEQFRARLAELGY